MATWTIPSVKDVPFLEEVYEFGEYNNVSWTRSSIVCTPEILTVWERVGQQAWLLSFVGQDRGV